MKFAIKLGLLCLLAGVSAASADTYPSKPITLIVPYAPRGEPSNPHNVFA